MLLGACGGAGTSGTTTGGPVTISYWSTDAQLQPEVDLWNQTHSNLHVTFTVHNSGDFLTQLETAIKAGQGPEVADVSAADVPALVAQGLIKNYKLPSYYPHDFIYPGLVPTIYDDVFPYGIPAPSFDPIVVFYQPALVAQLNLPNAPSPSAPWITYGQLATVAQAYLKNTGKPAVGIALRGDPTLFPALVWQHLGTWFTATSPAAKDFQATITGTQSLDVAKYWDTLVASGAAAVSPPEPIPGLTATPLVIGPLVETAQAIDRQGLSSQWAVGFAAQFDGDPDGPWCGTPPNHYLIIDHHVVGGPLEPTVTTFMNWLTTDPTSLDLQFHQGLLPALQSAYASGAVADLDAHYAIQGFSQVTQASAAHVATTFQYGPNMGFVYADEQKVFAQGSFASALATLQRDTVANLHQ